MMKWKGENMRYEFEHVLPADIESRSFAIIEEELTRMGRHLKEDEGPGYYAGYPYHSGF